jgi:hypothetical protein
MSIDIEDLKKKWTDGLLETNTSECKECLKCNDPNMQKRIAEAVASFANSNGGVIYFGIKDNKNVGKVEDAFIGLKEDSEFNKEFVDKIKSNLTSIPRFTCDKITISKNRAIYQVNIFKSIELIGYIHKNTVGIAEGTIVFYERQGAQNVAMRYHTIQKNMQNQEKIKNLRLGLCNEIRYNEGVVATALQHPVPKWDDDYKPELSEFLINNMDTLLESIPENLIKDIFEYGRYVKIINGDKTTYLNHKDCRKAKNDECDKSKLLCDFSAVEAKILEAIENLINESKIDE